MDSKQIHSAKIEETGLLYEMLQVEIDYPAAVDQFPSFSKINEFNLIYRSHFTDNQLNQSSYVIIEFLERKYLIMKENRQISIKLLKAVH